MTRSFCHLYRLGARRLLVAVAAFGAMACNNDLPLAPNPGNLEGSRLFSLEVQPATLRIRVGETGQFNVIGRDEAGLALGVAARWRVSSQTIASITDRGLVRGLREGRVTILATTANPPREARATLQIVSAASVLGTEGGVGLDPLLPENRFDGIIQARIQPTDALVAVGRTWQFVFSQGVGGAEAVGQARWRSSDPTIAQIGDNGDLLALRPGVVAIEASSESYDGVTAKTQVTVQAPLAKEVIRGIGVTPSALTMRVGDTAWLRSTITTWGGASDADVHWGTGDSSIVTVSETGRVVSLAPGQTVITASTNATWNAASMEARVPVSVVNATRSE
jgi:hypothetical protein